MKRFSEEHENLDTELNIVPIIDCFVMLICFLLFTAAFTQLVFLEAKLTSNTAAAAAKSRSELDQFRLVVALEDNGMRLTTAGSNARKENIFLPNVGGSYDYKALHGHVIAMKTQYPDRFSIDIEIKQKKTNVNYEKLIKTIDAVRHLDDTEFGALKVAARKIRKLELSDTEAARQVDESLQKLAESLLSNETSKNTDQKLLFPDVALLGVE